MSNAGITSRPPSCVDESHTINEEVFSPTWFGEALFRCRPVLDQSSGLHDVEATIELPPGVLGI
jgi:hypothetical protein